MMNQASIADIVELAASFGMLAPVTLADALKPAHVRSTREEHQRGISAG